MFIKQKSLQEWKIFAVSISFAALTFIVGLFFDSIFGITVPSIIRSMFLLMVFLIVVPILFISIVRQDRWQTFFVMSSQPSISLAIGAAIAIIVAVAAGFIFGTIAPNAELLGVAEYLTQSFMGFLLFEILTVLPLVFSGIFFFRYFLPYVFGDLKHAKEISYGATMLFFCYFLDPWWIGLAVILMIFILDYIRRSSYLVVSLSTCIMLIIFDAFIIKTFL